MSKEIETSLPKFISDLNEINPKVDQKTIKQRLLQYLNQIRYLYFRKYLNAFDIVYNYAPFLTQLNAFQQVSKVTRNEQNSLNSVLKQQAQIIDSIPMT